MNNTGTFRCFPVSEPRFGPVACFDRFIHMRISMAFFTDEIFCTDRCVAHYIRLSDIDRSCPNLRSLIIQKGFQCRQNIQLGMCDRHRVNLSGLAVHAKKS